MVYLLSAITTLTTLSWFRETPKLRPLPAYIQRKLIPSPNGDLELLICTPSASSSSSSPHQHPPIFFIHGGYGSAGVWLEWMTYLHKSGYTGTLYAFSARNHGASYTLPFWKMVWFTSFTAIQDDALTCLAAAEHLEQQTSSSSSFSRPPILIGHSSGGGIAQALLASGKTRTSGLALVDAIPSFGALDLYWNWLKHDPWFPIRNSFHLQHPTSPLSTDELVRSAFFSRQFPLSRAAEFRTWMPGFEAMGWPLDMMGEDILQWITGKGNRWLDCRDVVKGIERANTDSEENDKICILVGREDMMYRPPMWERQVAEYQDALQRRRSNLQGDGDKGKMQTEDGTPIEKVSIESHHGVRLILVADSGHHVQNDLWCDNAAEGLLRWIRQI